jgi:signal transduction histidine kinase
MKICFLAWILSCSWLLLFSQDKSYPDSLKLKLAETRDLNSRLLIMYNLAASYLDSDPKESIKWSQKLLTESKADTARKWEATAHVLLGLGHDMNGNLTMALQEHYNALEISSEIHQKDVIIACYTNIAGNYYELTDYQRSLEFNEKLLAASIDSKDSIGIVDSYFLLISTCVNLQKFETAHNYINKVKVMLSKSKNAERQFALLSASVYYFEAQSQIDSVLYYIDKALLICKKNPSLTPEGGRKFLAAGNPYNLTELYRIKAAMMGRQNRLDSADFYFNLSFKLLNQNYFTDSERRVCYSYSEFLMNKKNFQAASKYAHRALALSRQQKKYFDLSSVSKLLSDIMRGKKLLDSSLYYLEQHIQFKDSAINQSNIRKVESWSFAFQMKIKEKEKIELEKRIIADKQKLDQQRFIIVVVFLLVVVAVGIIYAQQKARKTREKYVTDLARKNEALENSIKKVSELNRRLDTLTSIVAHDIRAPLNYAYSALNILKMSPISFENSELIDAVTNSIDQGFLFIHQLLVAKTIRENPLKNDHIQIASLIEKQIEMFRYAAQKKNITLKAFVKPIDLVTNQVCLENILSNLISNAIKFSPPHTQVSVSAKRLEDGVEFTVSDEGAGFSDADKELVFKSFKKLSAQPTGGESSHGIGLVSVAEFLEILGGRIQLISEKGKGAQFIFVIPQRKIIEQEPKSI